MQALFFDLDGTLLDSAPDILAIAADIAREHQQPLVGENHMRAGISGGSGLVLSRIFKRPIDDPFIIELRQEFLSRYRRCSYNNTQLFPGVEDMLTQLQQQAIPWGIITNKYRDLSEAIINTLAPLQQSKVLVCGDDLPQAKPDPAGLMQAAQKVGVPAQQCWYLGDSINDMRAANDAGMYPLLASWGYIDDEDSPEVWGAAESFTNVHALQQRLTSELGI